MNRAVLNVILREQDISKTIKNNAQQDFFTTFTPTICWPFRNQQEVGDRCRLLILDSSFNPPTNAHISLLKKSLEAYPSNYFHGILLLFSINNVDKVLTGASALQRAQMMELVASKFKEYNVAVGFTTHGKFVDKAASIQSWFSRHYPHHVLDIFFILGYDTVVRLLDPKYYHDVPVKTALESFFKTCRLICADRGENREEQDAFWKQVEQEYGTHIFTRIQLDLITCQYSSTMARQAIVNQDKKVESILDKSIVEFVEQQGLYLQ